MNFLGESHRYGLSSVMICQWFKCSMLFWFTTSEVTSYSTTNHYTVNIGATLGQIATGGGADHLKEQLACIQVPSLSTPSFINLEHSMGATSEAIVSTQLLTAGKMERQLAIAQGNYYNGVPAITVVDDAGWSKRSHKHSYNANSGVGVMFFGAVTKALLFIGVRNKKYCSICAINTRNNKPIPTHQCYCNWSGSSCSMEADIILEGFQLSEEMHSLRYLWLIQGRRNRSGCSGFGQTSFFSR